MYYVYCLVSEAAPSRRYAGFTEDLCQRIIAHNNGQNVSTARLGPWKIKGYVAFGTREQALRFERYLKSGSGHAFAAKRLW